MRKTLLLAAVAASVTLSTLAFAEEKEENEVKVKMSDVPAVVQDTIKKEAFGATLPTDVDREGDGAKAVYEVDVKIDGKNYEIKVAQDGTLVSKKLDSEEGEKDQKGEHKDEGDAKKKDKD